MTTINNLKPYYTAYPYTVARVVDGDWWFWGCFRTFERAAEVADALDGEVFRPEEIIEGTL